MGVDLVSEVMTLKNVQHESIRSNWDAKVLLGSGVTRSTRNRMTKACINAVGWFETS